MVCACLYCSSYWSDFLPSEGCRSKVELIFFAQKHTAHFPRSFIRARTRVRRQEMKHALEKWATLLYKGCHRAGKVFEHVHNRAQSTYIDLHRRRLSNVVSKKRLSAVGAFFAQKHSTLPAFVHPCSYPRATARDKTCAREVGHTTLKRVSSSRQSVRARAQPGSIDLHRSTSTKIVERCLKKKGSRLSEHFSQQKHSTLPAFVHPCSYPRATATMQRKRPKVSIAHPNRCVARRSDERSGEKASS